MIKHKRIEFRTDERGYPLIELEPENKLLSEFIQEAGSLESVCDELLAKISKGGEWVGDSFVAEISEKETSIRCIFSNESVVVENDDLYNLVVMWKHFTSQLPRWW